MGRFIKTKDAMTASRLRKAGFTELPHEGQAFVFLNDAKANFSEEDRQKLAFTNIVSV